MSLSSAVETTAPSGTESTTYVVLSVGGSSWCLDVRSVREIVPTPRITRVPGAPSGISGVINVRGRVIPLGDLGLALGFEESVVGPRATAVVLDLGVDGADLAVLAEVVDVLELGDDRLDLPPDFGLGLAAPFVRAVAHLADDELALVLEPNLLFQPTDVPSLPDFHGAGE